MAIVITSPFVREVCAGVTAVDSAGFDVAAPLVDKAAWLDISVCGCELSVV